MQSKKIVEKVSICNSVIEIAEPFFGTQLSYELEPQSIVHHPSPNLVKYTFLLELTTI